MEYDPDDPAGLYVLLDSFVIQYESNRAEYWRTTLDREEWSPSVQLLRDADDMALSMRKAALMLQYDPEDENQHSIYQLFEEMRQQAEEYHKSWLQLRFLVTAAVANRVISADEGGEIMRDVPKLKIATFNVEWMISIFGAPKKGAWNGNIPATFPGKSLGSIKLAPITDVPALCSRIAGVILAMNAPIVALQEAAPEAAMLNKFAQQHLNSQYTAHTSNYSTQAVAYLVRNDVAPHVKVFPLDSPEAQFLAAKIPYYPWTAFKAEERKHHRFARVPLVLEYAPPGGESLYLVAVHTKSKFSKLKTRKQWEDRMEAAVLDALNQRQKLSAEIVHLREFITGHIRSGNQSVVVLGDFNDGPFFDLMEQEFLVHNILDELVGTFLEPESFLRHAMDPDTLSAAATVRFPDPLQDGKMIDELIDHVLVSPAIWRKQGRFEIVPNSCKVETQAFNQHNDGDDQHRDRHLRPSDHKPVSVELEF